MRDLSEPAHYPHYQVAVRALCAFVDKQGDLDLHLISTPTAQEGIARHTLADEIVGNGHAFSQRYHWLGLQKVVQAAGQVIRRTTDLGVIRSA